MEDEFYSKVYANIKQISIINTSFLRIFDLILRKKLILDADDCRAAETALASLYADIDEMMTSIETLRNNNIDPEGTAILDMISDFCSQLRRTNNAVRDLISKVTQRGRSLGSDLKAYVEAAKNAGKISKETLSALAALNRVKTDSKDRQ